MVRSWLVKHDEMWHSDYGSNMVQRGEVQHDDKEQHNDRCSKAMESLWRISWSSMSSTEFSYLMYHLLRDDLCSYYDKSNCWLLMYMYFLSLYWTIEEYKKNWSRVSPHWGLSLAGATSCVLLSLLVFYCLCLCSICILLSCWCDC